jgi:hypothetical protein
VDDRCCSAVIFFRYLPQGTEGDVTSEESGVIERGLKLCKQLLDDWSRQLLDFIPAKQKYPEQQEYIESKEYMRRFINNLLEASKFSEDVSQDLDTHLHIALTTKQLKILQQFSKGNNDVTLLELVQVLSAVHMLSQSSIFLEKCIQSKEVRSINQMWQHM